MERPWGSIVSRESNGKPCSLLIPSRNGQGGALYVAMWTSKWIKLRWEQEPTLTARTRGLQYKVDLCLNSILKNLYGALSLAVSASDEDDDDVDDDDDDDDDEDDDDDDDATS